MPWPERDLTTRLLAGIVGAVLGAVIVFIVLAYGYFTLHSPTGLPWIGAAAGACVGFVAGFIGGDPAVRFLARLLGGGPGAA
jgi:hypothetical protein